MSLETSGKIGFLRQCPCCSASYPLVLKICTHTSLSPTCKQYIPTKFRKIPYQNEQVFFGSILTIFQLKMRTNVSQQVCHTVSNQVLEAFTDTEWLSCPLPAHYTYWDRYPILLFPFKYTVWVQSSDMKNLVYRNFQEFTKYIRSNCETKTKHRFKF